MVDLVVSKFYDRALSVDRLTAAAPLQDSRDNKIGVLGMVVVGFFWVHGGEFLDTLYTIA